MTRAAHPPMDATTFRLLQQLIRQTCGISFTEEQRELLALKLLPRLQALGLSSYLEYYYLLKYTPQGAEEWARLLPLLAVNETYFWREFEQIEAVARVLVPQWQRQATGRHIRIWHAGCASGEEPYTMAIALNETQAFQHGPIEILGTDLNPQALEQAFRGIYRARSLRAIPAEIQRKYFTPLEDGRWQLKAKIRRRVRFFPLNLVDEEAMQAMRDFDVIFCRNVFIYFAPETIRKVSERFFHSLRDEGVLFLGAAESLLHLSPRFALTDIGGALGYRKILEKATP